MDDPRLIFLGAVPAEQMPRVYRCVDALVVASVGECPLTVLEAMSSGLPVVLNDDPALHSPWTAGPGVRFVDLTPARLRQALEALTDDPDAARAAGVAGQKFVEGRFSWDAHVDRLEETYRHLLAPPPL
jgi:glycosyltransferase involved in cell wall biosynthesis